VVTEGGGVALGLPRPLENIDFDLKDYRRRAALLNEPHCLSFRLCWDRYALE
jgi:hypothetical protein